MSDTAIKTSALLAKDHGVYPKYKPEAIEQSAFYSKNALGETKELVSSFGLRNSQLLTIAPTGSLSTMLDLFPNLFLIALIQMNVLNHEVQIHLD